MFIQTEATPNPATLKFLPGRDVLVGEPRDFRSAEDAAVSPLASGLCDWDIENIYEIYPQWRHRYAPGVVHNTEHLFSLQVPEGTAITLSPREHTAYRWLPYLAAAEACFSPSNAEAILMLPRFIEDISPNAKAAA